MNRAVFGTLLVAAVACVAVLSWSLPQQAVNAQPGAKAQQWEYKVVKTDFAQPEQQFMLAAMKKIPDLALVVPRGLGNRLSLQR